MSGKVIVTRRSAGHIMGIVRHGTKRQRAKYRNAYVVLCAKGRCIVGVSYFDTPINKGAEARLSRAERRMGIPTPMFDNAGRVEPAWHGVKGMVGLSWTLDGDVYVGRS